MTGFFKINFVRFLPKAFLLILIITGCSKEEQPPDMPFVYVNFSLNPNSTEYINLNTVNGWETVTGGYQGILLFRISLNEFAAYERACPYDPLTPGAQIRVEESGITCYCPVCKSRYIMTDGTPFEGPSHFPLKQYMTTYDGFLLYVYN